MTREDAAELLKAFRRDGTDVPAIDARALAHAYLAVLGSLPDDTREGTPE